VRATVVIKFSPVKAAIASSAGAVEIGFREETDPTGFEASLTTTN
jgi:hypothetical protein